MTLPSSEITYRIFGTRSKTINDIMDFRRLPLGWHYGRGGPISQRVCIWALQLNSYAINLGFQVTEAFPGVDGEVMVSVYSSHHTLDFTVNPDGTVIFRHEIDDDDVEALDNLTLDAAKRKLTTVGNALWNLSGSSILSTSATNRGNSRISHLNPVRVMGESRLLTENVVWQPANHSVGI